MGPEASGKSTIANAIVSGADSLFFNEKRKKFFTSKDLEYEGRAVFKLRHTKQDLVHLPSIYPIDSRKSTYLVDLPGFCDNVQSSEILTLNFIQ